MIYNPETPIRNENSFEVAKDSLITIQKLSFSIRDEMHKSHDGDYKQSFITLFKENLCNSELIDISLIPEDCSTMLNNAPINVLVFIFIHKFYRDIKQF